MYNCHFYGKTTKSMNILQSELKRLLSHCHHLYNATSMAILLSQYICSYLYEHTFHHAHTIISTNSNSRKDSRLARWWNTASILSSESSSRSLLLRGSSCGEFVFLRKKIQSKNARMMLQ